MLIGYAQVSTDDQHFDLQRDALAKAERTGLDWWHCLRRYAAATPL